MPLNAQTVDPTLAFWLKIGSGIFWTITYILIIRRGFKDKTYGMPLVALCANVSWEFIFSFVFPHKSPQIYIDYVWLFFDLFIVGQYLLFGRKDFPSALSPKLFYPVFFTGLVCAYLAILCISFEFEDFRGIYAAFGQNLLMSVLFVQFLLRRNNVEGQSMYIALCKMIGTLIPSFYFHLHFPNSALLTFLFFSIAFFDLAYCVFLYLKLKESAINPWSRA